MPDAAEEQTYEPGEAAKVFAGMIRVAHRARVVLPVTYLKDHITGHKPGKPQGDNGAEPEMGWVKVELPYELVMSTMGEIDEAPAVAMLVLIPQQLRDAILNPPRIISPHAPHA